MTMYILRTICKGKYSPARTNPNVGVTCSRLRRICTSNPVTTD